MTTTPVPIRDAASILLIDRNAVDGPSVLMGQRGKAAAFMPMKYVFPGGALDPDDHRAGFACPLPPLSVSRLGREVLEGSTATPEGLAAAALRELVEETGLICGAPDAAPIDWPGYATLGMRPDPSGLIYIFRAITPPHLSRRFDTRFFLMDSAQIHGDPHDFSQACDELSNIHWVPLPQARQLDLPFITEIVLAEVSALLNAAGDAPLGEPEGVPFFDNRSNEPRFLQIT